MEEIDAGNLPQWKEMDAPPIAVKYWKLAEGAKMRDVILAIRSDEAHHREVNHTFGTWRTCDNSINILGELKPTQPNPFGPGE